MPLLRSIAEVARDMIPKPTLFLEEINRLIVTSDLDQDDFVRLGTVVLYKDLKTKRQRSVRVVGPGGENADDNEVSLLSPIGSALFGLTAGSIFRWSGLDGQLRAIKVLQIIDGAGRSTVR